MISEYYSRIMATKQIQCPNCGAELQASQLVEVECPYCGSKFENPLNKRSDDGVIKKIIPFSLSANDVREIIFKEFVYKDDVAKDIFDKLQIHTLKQYYLPMYLFYGKYRADWSCTVIYDQRDRQGNIIKEHRPASGTATGNFSKLTLACGAGRNLPQGLKRYANVLEWTSKLDSKITKFEASYLVGENKEAIEVIESSITEKEAWNKSALQSSIEKDAKNAAHSQTPNRVIENYNVTANWEGRGELVLVPVWYGSYAYNGEEHFFAIDGRGTNFDYSYPHDSTNKVRGWKVVGRFFLMVGLLIGIIGFTSIKQTIPINIAYLGAVALTIRFVMEYNKSSNDLIAIKQVGKARFCGEEIPNSSSNYVQFKRTNQIAMWVLIALIATWCFGAKMVEDNQRKQQQAEEQALFDNAKKTINQITPDLFFHKSDSQIGHLRQDIVSQLTRLGFVKDNEHPNQTALSTTEVYSLYMDYEYSPIKIILNDRTHGLVENKNEIRDICIKIYDLTLADEIMSAFKDNIERNGFVVASDINIKSTSPFGTSLPILINSDSYIRIGKTVRKQGILSEELYFNYDVVEFKKGYSEAEIVCYSHADKNINTTEVEETVEPILTDSVVSDREYSNRDDAAVDRMVETAPAE